VERGSGWSGDLGDRVRRGQDVDLQVGRRVASRARARPRVDTCG